MSDAPACGPVRFSKMQSEYLTDCIINGKPIPPPNGEWNVLDMLAVAGGLLFAAGTHPGADGKDARLIDLFAAVSFHAQLTELVLDGTYDADFGPEVKAAVTKTEDNVAVQFISGYKEP